MQELYDKGLIHCPSWLPPNTMYLTLMGSVAYGCSSDTSDMDLYGFCIPQKDVIFPHLAGEILDFGTAKKRFHQYQEHHIIDKDALAGKGREYDFSIYNIVKYFHLVMENNPNCIDSLFTPQNCVLHITQVGQMIRDNKKIFLHKGCWSKFKGYSYSQLSKMETKSHEGLDELIKFEEDYNIPHTLTLEEALKPNASAQFDVNELTFQKYISMFQKVMSRSKRAERVKIAGFDVKFAYHIVRLLDEVEQILTLGDLDLQRAKEHMKAIRRGDVSKEEIISWFQVKEKQLEAIYESSALPYSPDEERIKQLLLSCLEHHYGSLEKCIVNENVLVVALRNIRDILSNLNLD